MSPIAIIVLFLGGFILFVMMKQQSSKDQPTNQPTSSRPGVDGAPTSNATPGLVTPDISQLTVNEANATLESKNAEGQLIYQRPLNGGRKQSGDKFY